MLREVAHRRCTPKITCIPAKNTHSHPPDNPIAKVRNANQAHAAAAMK